MLNLSMLKNKIPIYSRAEVLADVVSLKKINNYWFTWKNDNYIFSSKILSDQKLDPTIINGSY